LLLSSCGQEEYSRQDLHILNPRHDTNGTDPVSAQESTGAGAASATPASSDAGAADATTATPATPAPPTFVSDLAFTVVANGYGPAEKNTSNGENVAGDGKTITLGGVTFEKGIGVHAASEIDVPLGGQYKSFLADVGVDDEVMANGSIVFRVLVDGVEKFNSGTMTGDAPAKKVMVDVSGKQTLKLVVDDGGDGIGSDHGDWAGARLQK